MLSYTEQKLVKGRRCNDDKNWTLLCVSGSFANIQWQFITNIAKHWAVAAAKQEYKPYPYPHLWANPVTPHLWVSKWSSISVLTRVKVTSLIWRFTQTAFSFSLRHFKDGWAVKFLVCCNRILNGLKLAEYKQNTRQWGWWSDHWS